MKRRIFFPLIFILLATWQPVSAQTQTVTIRLRRLDGTPIPQESVRVIRLPDDTEYTAVTDLQGLAHFEIGRGIYEVHLSTMLDEVSALAVAEGGLEGFGITVGDADIQYSFVLHSDRRFYFDATPELESASPIIPQLEDLHFVNGAIQPTATPQTAVTVASTLTPEAQTDFDQLEKEMPQTPWLFFVVVASMMGTYLFWTRKKQNAQAEGK